MPDHARPSELLKPIVEVGRNCWRIERAPRAAVVVDAASYYHFIREAMEAAERRILLIGWDFDTRISLEPDEHGGGETLGMFFLRLARDRPDREVRILKWSFGALKQLFHPRMLTTLMRWRVTRAISFRFDSAHPLGCSHHQKIVVIDRSFAVCGGIDISAARWDTCDHIDDDPRRRLPGGTPYGPWHDATMLVDGKVAAALADLSEERWLTATHDALPAVETSTTHWPEDVKVRFSDVDIAIARTRAEYGDVSEVREIEALYLDMIAAAKRFIYFENQYFTSGKIGAAIAKRLAEPDPPEFVLVMPRSADGWLEQKAMDGARVQLARAIGKADPQRRFRIYVPVTPGGADIYVHAKIAVVDDRLLRVGSSNMNNRSLGLDSECDVIIDCALAANADAGGAIGDLRCELMAEHLGVTAEAIAASFAETGSLHATIAALNGNGRHLDPLALDKVEGIEEFIADNELLDPESADGFFEPLHKRSIWKSWRKGLAWRPRFRRG